MKGLVIGKFYPPHNGHHFLIDTALSATTSLDVLVCDHPDYAIPAHKRAEWLRVRHPSARVRIIQDIGKDDDSAAWAQHTQEFLGYTPDIVFSSEHYGDTYAKYMKALHLQLDTQRLTAPISGTEIRADVLKHSEHLEPHVKANFVQRIVVLGAESTGTTTLTNLLAQHYKTNWVAEYGRVFTQSLHEPFLYRWTTEDFIHIAQMQHEIETYMAGRVNKFLFCDTNALATSVWHKRYIGSWCNRLVAMGNTCLASLYVITAPDIPFVQDGVRDGKHLRLRMHEDFVSAVKLTGVPYIVVNGPLKQRLSKVNQAIEQLEKVSLP